MIRTVFALFCLLALAVAPRADTLMLAPKYDVAGTNPNGSKYAGTATIEVISDTTFAIRWEIGSSVFKGFGMRMNDSLAATYDRRRSGIDHLQGRRQRRAERAVVGARP